MAKKKAGGKKTAKSGRPSWMSEEAYSITQDLARLVEHFNATSATPQLDPGLAGMYLWRMLYGSDKKTQERREEALKLGVVDAGLKLLAVALPVRQTVAVGVLTTLLATPTGREAFFGIKAPSPLTSLLQSIEKGNVCLAAYSCKLLAQLGCATDAKLRVMKGMEGWKWTPLVRTLRSRQAAARLGGEDACCEIGRLVAALCCVEAIPENAAPNAYAQLCAALNDAAIEAEMVEALAELLRNRAPNRCKAAAAEGLKTLLNGPRSDEVQRRFVERKGRESVVALLGNAFFSLPTRAALAECLCRTLLPSSAHDAALGRDDFEASGNSREIPLDGSVLRDVVPLLLQLCLGPDGPLKEIIASDGAAPRPRSKSKKGKKGAKLEAGMAEAQIFATGALRILAVSEAAQSEIMQHHGVRYVAPLLASKLQQTRWNARHILLTLASVPDYAAQLDRYQVPKYVTRRHCSAV